MIQAKDYETFSPMIYGKYLTGNSFDKENKTRQFKLL